MYLLLIFLIYIYIVNRYIYIYTLKYAGILSKHVHNNSMLRYSSHTSAKESRKKDQQG